MTTSGGTSQGTGGVFIDRSSRLPADIEAAAFRTSSGEYAWRKQDLRRVLDYCLTSSIAILGGEAWIVRRLEDCGPDDPTEFRHNLDPQRREKGHVLARTRSHVVYGSLLFRDGRHEMFTWDLSGGSASWREYVERTVNETREIIESSNLEADVIPEYAPYVHYNLNLAFNNREH